MSALALRHKYLHMNLPKVQCKNGFWVVMGPVVEKWIKTGLTPYVIYCSNLIQVNHTTLQSINISLTNCVPRPSFLFSLLDEKQSEDVLVPGEQAGQLPPAEVRQKGGGAGQEGGEGAT